MTLCTTLDRALFLLLVAFVVGLELLRFQDELVKLIRRVSVWARGIDWGCAFLGTAFFALCGLQVYMLLDAVWTHRNCSYSTHHHH